MSIKIVAVGFIITTLLCCHTPDKPDPPSDKPEPPPTVKKIEVAKPVPKKVMPILKKDCVENSDCTYSTLVLEAGDNYCCHSCGQTAASKTSRQELEDFCRLEPKGQELPGGRGIACSKLHCAKQNNGILECVNHLCAFSNRLNQNHEPITKPRAR